MLISPVTSPSAAFDVATKQLDSARRDLVVPPNALVDLTVLAKNSVSNAAQAVDLLTTYADPSRGTETATMAASAISLANKGIALLSRLDSTSAYGTAFEQADVWFADAARALVRLNA